MKTSVRAACLALLAAALLGTPAQAQQRERVPPQVEPSAGQPGKAAAESITPVQPPADKPAEAEMERMAEQMQNRRYRRPVFRLGQDYTLRAGDGAVHVVTVLGDVTIEGTVRDDVIVTMGSARLASTARIEGVLVVVGGSVNADEGAYVGRDVVVIGGTLTTPGDVLSSHGEQVVIGTPGLGRSLDRVVPWFTQGLIWGRLIVPGLAWVWWVVAFFFLVYLAVNTIFDRPVSATAGTLLQRPLSVFMLGLLVLLLTVPVLAILAASVIGIAVVPFVLCAIVAAAIVGKVAVLRAIGLGAFGGDGRVQGFLAFVLGFIVVSLAYMVPVLGVLTWALTSVIGLGAAAATFRTSLRRERPAVAPPPPAPAPAPAGIAPVAANVSERAAVMEEPSAATVGAGPVMPQPGVETPPVPPPPIPPPPSAFSQGLAAYPRATFLDRVAAFALDAILVAIANGVLLDMGRYEGMFFFLLLVYHMAFWAWRGTTLGGIIVSLRVVRTHGTELRATDALVRGLSAIFSIVALGIGCLWMLQDPEKQMWHDKIAGTLVVKVPRDLVLP